MPMVVANLWRMCSVDVKIEDSVERETQFPDFSNKFVEDDV